MSSSASLASRVHDRHVGNCQLLTLATPVDDFVAFRASFVTNPDFAAGDDIIQDLAVAMLDKGTKRHDRFELSGMIEDIGASIDTFVDGLYVEATGKALTNDLPTVLNVLAEMLQEPLFDPEEFEKVRAMTIAQLQHQLEKTSSQAGGALKRQLFPKDHPNYAPPTEELIEQAQAATLEDVKAFFGEHVGARDFRMAVVGDLDHDVVESAVLSAFEEWEPHESDPVHATQAAPKEAGRSLVPMADRSNIDVNIGHALDMYRGDNDYEPFYVANFILGGNFSARLMNEVRDEKGLTYHISSSIAGISTKHQGAWRAVVTLSTEAFEEGVDATIDVIRRFVREGITEEELETVKTTITGSFVVGLATTTNLSKTLLTNAEREFDVEYIDRFPEIINGLTREEVNAAIRRHIQPDNLHIAAAGAFPERVEV
jgi:predicted Zn-dependent peptidase